MFSFGPRTLAVNTYMRSNNILRWSALVENDLGYTPARAKIAESRGGGKGSTCKYKNTCGGCRAREFTETGYVLGGVESCEGGPGGHPLESLMGKNFLKTYRINYPAMLLYRFLKRLW